MVDWDVVLWVVGMLPDVVCAGRIESILAVEEPANSTWCVLCFVRAFRDEFLRKSHKTMFVSQ